MDAASSNPIIIKRVRKTAAAHHGGAWKVAYADFVTAMMALFIVLWLVNADEATKKAIAGYFNDPKGSKIPYGNRGGGQGDAISLGEKDMSQLKKKIEQAVRTVPDLDRKLNGHVQMTVTGEGLRIELLETETGLFFEKGNAAPTDEAKRLLSVMAAELARLNNSLLVEGHTDSRPFAGGQAYSNWELSADRANAARRLMLGAGLRPEQVSQVRGFADQRLRDTADPNSPSNRRISVVVQYGDQQAEAPANEAAPNAAPVPGH